MGSFLITANGRSGTQFLAHVMNKSRQWTVRHEPRPTNLNMPVKQVQPLFDRDYYGEVNGFRRRIFYDLQVAQRGIILRNPFEIAVSSANKRRGKPEDADIMVESWEILLGAIADPACRVISFRLMTTDVDYLGGILEHFGIADVDITPADLTPINYTRNKKYKKFSDLPEATRKQLQPECDRYYELVKSLL